MGAGQSAPGGFFKAPTKANMNARDRALNATRKAAANAASAAAAAANAAQSAARKGTNQTAASARAAAAKAEAASEKLEQQIEKGEQLIEKSNIPPTANIRNALQTAKTMARATNAAGNAARASATNGTRRNANSAASAAAKAKTASKGFFSKLGNAFKVQNRTYAAQPLFGSRKVVNKKAANNKAANNKAANNKAANNNAKEQAMLRAWKGLLNQQNNMIQRGRQRVRNATESIRQYGTNSIYMEPSKLNFKKPLPMNPTSRRSPENRRNIYSLSEKEKRRLINILLEKAKPFIENGNTKAAQDRLDMALRLAEGNPELNKLIVDSVGKIN
jgi:hypothetical protein